jgi:5-methylcytosine-specific restriction endonuclease McrA
MTRPLAEQKKRQELLAKGLKPCSKCREVKPIDEFGKRPKNSDGLMGWCKACYARYHQKWYCENRERALARSHEYAKTLQFKRYQKRYKRENRERIRRYKKAYYQKHRERISVVDQERYLRNREHILAQKKEYRRTHRAERRENNKDWVRRNPGKRRAQRLRYKLSHLEEYRKRDSERSKRYYRENPEIIAAQRARRRARVHNADGEYSEDQWLKLLEMCGESCAACGATEDLTRDHIIPLTWGGSNFITNLQPLCKTCNSIKQDLYAADYRPRRVRRWAFQEAQNGN